MRLERYKTGYNEVGVALLRQLLTSVQPRRGLHPWEDAPTMLKGNRILNR